MKFIIIITLTIILSACSIFKGTEKEEQTSEGQIEEVYVFDEVSDNNNTEEEINTLKDEVDNTFSEVNTNTKSNELTEATTQASENTYEGNVFHLQLGAFTTLKRAEQFVTEIDAKVPFKLSVIYNSTNSLYTVRSSPYATKNEVKSIRDNFWNNNLFLDSFIVSE